MYSFNPRENKLRALERNILKYRTFETMMILFYVENIKTFALRSLQVSDKIHSKKKERLPIGTRNIYKKLWQILLHEGVLTLDEKEDIEKIINFRNDVAHSIHYLVSDLNPDSFSRSGWKIKEIKYDYGALDRLKKYEEKIYMGLSGKYAIDLSMNPMLFKPAENVYLHELKRLDKKIRKLLKERKEENRKLKSEIDNLDKKILDKFGLLHKPNGQLSPNGIECINSLFSMGLSNLAISYIMRLSLKAVNKRRLSWDRKTTDKKG